jgi:GxxExxY protein
MKTREELNEISKQILDASITVHREMGPGLLESVYQLCLAHELSLRNLSCTLEVPVPLLYKGHPLSKDYFMDILVDNEVIVELKAVEELLPIHEAQLISYLRISKKRLGLLINLNVTKIKYGFRRFVNNF